MSNSSPCPPYDPTYGCVGQGTISYHKDLAAWIPSARKFVPPLNSVTTIEIDRLNQPGSSTNYLMARIPIPGSSQFYTVEARRFIGYDNKVPAEAIVIHHVDATRANDAWVVDADGNLDGACVIPQDDANCDPDDAGAQWTPGETYSDAANAIQIRVNAITATGFSVTITYGSVVMRTLTVAGAGTGSGTVTATGISCTITAGSTSGDCSESYPDGTSVTLTATAASGSTFAGWTNCDAPSGNQCTMTMNANKTVTATFNILGPANDNFANAQDISGDSGSITGSNVGATKEPCEPNHHNIPGGASVWYRWTAPIGGNATFDTFGSNFDTVLAVYTGDNLCSLTYIASSDDDPLGGLQSRVSFNAVAGTTYHIAVDGFGGFSSPGAASASKGKISTAAVAMGDIVLNWSMCPGVTVTSSPKKVTYKPTPTRPSKKTITVRVVNKSGGTRVVTNIVPLLEEPFIVTSIRPTLPKAIPNRRTQSFTVYTEVPAGWPPVTATQPYFVTVLDCGAFTTASEPQLLVPLQVHDVQVESQGGQVRVEATGVGIASVRLQLYDLAGRLMLNKESQGDTLTLPFKTLQGRALANGVYLYVVRVQGFDGREYVSEVRKLVIMR
jgi:hypothetical protein